MPDRQRGAEASNILDNTAVCATTYDPGSGEDRAGTCTAKRAAGQGILCPAPHKVRLGCLPVRHVKEISERVSSSLILTRQVVHFTHLSRKSTRRALSASSSRSRRFKGG